MGLLDFFKGRSIQKQTAAFYQDNGVIPDFGSRQVAARTSIQVLEYFSKHPGWRQLPQDVLSELSTRVADRSRKWVTYDIDHALEVLVFMTEKSNALAHNFIPICRDNDPLMDTPEARLYLFAMTFYNLASKYVREITEHRDRLPEDKVAVGLEDATAFAEASLTCDRYLLTSFIPAAYGWVLKSGDIDKAITILDEGIRWAGVMGIARPHKASPFDEQVMNDPCIDLFEETKQEILEMR